MPHKKINIPKEEQLEALSRGLPEFYQLLESYVGDLNLAGDIRLYVSITKKELADYLRNKTKLMEKHLFKGDSPRFHEQPILEYNGKKYIVYEMDHEEPWDITEYEDFAEATAEYLLYNLERPVKD